jgi:hypothetical protein
VWVVGEAGTVLHWDGRAWQKLPAPTDKALRAIRAIGSDIYVAGAAGTVWRWNGQAWTALESGLPAMLVAMDVDADGITAVGEVSAIVEGRRSGLARSASAAATPRLQSGFPPRATPQ